MITRLTFEFQPSELKKVMMHGTIFEQIDFDSVTIINQYDTLEDIKTDQLDSVLYNIKQYGCYYRIGASLIQMFVNFDSDKLEPKTKDIIKMYLRDTSLDRILE